MACASGCSVVPILLPGWVRAACRCLSWDEWLGLAGCIVSSLHEILQILIGPEENGCLDFVGAQDTSWAGCLQCFHKRLIIYAECDSSNRRGQDPFQIPWGPVSSSSDGRQSSDPCPRENKGGFASPSPSFQRREYLSGWMDGWACSFSFSALCKVQSPVQMVFSSKTK